MENASKALIIAGAILLSILIIGLGMFIYQQASNAMKGTGLESQQAAAYNSEFLQYGNGNITGAQARQLCNVVVAHNNAASDYTEFIKVQSGSAESVTSNGYSESTKKTDANKDTNAVRITITSGSTYTVDFGYDTETGYIVAIGIKDNRSK